MSAVITLAIVGMWCAYLVPMWLHRHDALTESRSVDRFNTAMRVLSRRPAPAPAGTPVSAVGRRAVLMPGRPAAPAEVTVSGTGRPVSQPRPVLREAPAVYRRRRVFAVTLVLAVASVPVALVASGWAWLQLALDAAVALEVVYLRRCALRDAAARRTATRRSGLAAAARLTAPESAGVGARRSVPAEAGQVAYEAAFEQTHAGRAPQPREERPAVDPVTAPVVVQAPAPAASATARRPSPGRAAPARRVQPERVQAERERVAAEAAAAERVAAQREVAARISAGRAASQAARQAAAPAQKVLDLTVPGVWSKGDLLDDSTMFADDDTLEIDRIIDRRIG